jgi:hypothetical protein
VIQRAEHGDHRLFRAGSRICDYRFIRHPLNIPFPVAQN